MREKIRSVTDTPDTGALWGVLGQEFFDRKALICTHHYQIVTGNGVASVYKFAQKVASSPSYIDSQKWEQLTSLHPDDYTNVGVSRHSCHRISS